MSPVDVQIKIFDNSISFFNPGKLFGDLTVKDLKTNNYQAYARNKLLAEAFYLTGDIEKYGSGFKRVLNEISQYPTMNLECREIPNGFFVELSYVTQKTVTYVEHTGNGTDDVTSNVTDDVTSNVTNDVTDDVTCKIIGRGSLIISLIKENSKISTVEMANKLEVSKRTILRELDLLKKNGLLKRIGDNTNGYWKIT